MRYEVLSPHGFWLSRTFNIFEIQGFVAPATKYYVNVHNKKAQFNFFWNILYHFWSTSIALLFSWSFMIQSVQRYLNWPTTWEWKQTHCLKLKLDLWIVLCDPNLVDLYIYIVHCSYNSNDPLWSYLCLKGLPKVNPKQVAHTLTGQCCL